jgi:hypothetical protein
MRRRGPGLVRGVARTAVVAGTATAVSGRVARRQNAKYADQDAATAAERQTAYDEQVATQEPAPPSAPEADVATQIQQLAALKDQGLLTEEEFSAKKKQILGI